MYIDISIFSIFDHQVSSEAGLHASSGQDVRSVRRVSGGRGDRCAVFGARHLGSVPLRQESRHLRRSGHVRAAHRHHQEGVSD